MKYIIFYIFIFIIILYLNFFYSKKDYLDLILLNRNKTDYVKWYLSDKSNSKKFVLKYNIKVPKTYQVVKYPKQIKFNNLPRKFVIKPRDLSDCGGVFAMNNGTNLLDGRKYSNNEIILELYKLRAYIDKEYYMHDNMYNGRIFSNGYIIEEFLGDKIPDDYKCYTFNGKIHYIAVTYDRKIVDGVVKYKSTWFDRDWNPIKNKMSKKNYFFKKLKKPKNFSEIVRKIEKISNILGRHCRIDIYIVNDILYFGEFTFFTGAWMHTNYCNRKLGDLWHKYPDKLKEIKF